MSVRYSRMADGSLAAWVFDEPSNFAAVCDLVVRELGGEVREELIGLDQSYVDVEVDGHLVTLHSEAFMGVAVLATTPETEATVRRVAEHVDAHWTGAGGG
jgi:hypothetical protein